MIELLQALSLPFLGFCLIAMTAIFAFMTFKDHARERREREDAANDKNKGQIKGARRRV